MSLMMLHLPVSARALFAAGRDHGLVRDGWSVDTGYLVHALFARLFGAEAPKPFDVQETKAGASGELAVLAYAASDHRSLAARAAAADGGAAHAIAWDRAGSKPMPVFGEGQRLCFRLRVCPVVRVGRQHARFAPGAEVDPYLALVQQRLASAGPFPIDAAEQACRQAIIAELPAREAVYEDWLAARMGEAAALRTARLVAQRDARLWRRGEPGPGAASRMHGRARAGQGARRVIGRREAVFEGELAVGDPAAFAALLARGVGRHRAFGFGMLLLRPPAGG
jgi:CRISPR system Cascade subunit CasE